MSMYSRGGQLPVGEILGHGLYRRPGHPFLRELLRVPAHDAGHGFPGRGQPLGGEAPADVPALFDEAPHGQGLPAPEGLEGKPQQGVDTPAQPAQAPAEEQHPQGQEGFALKAGDRVTLEVSAQEPCILTFGAFRSGAFLEEQTARAQRHSFTFAVQEEGLYCFSIEYMSAGVGLLAGGVLEVN